MSLAVRVSSLHEKDVMNRPGRNAPCPCGSGKKYKKCCALKVVAFPLRYTRADRATVYEKLERFGTRPTFAHDFKMASTIFFGMTEAIMEDLPGHAKDEAATQFMSWYLCDMDLDDGATIASMMLDERAGELTPGERTFLRAWSNSAVQCYRVIEVRPDEGITLEDVVSKDRVDVREKLGTRGLASWDVLFTRVIQGGDGASLVMEGGIMHFRAMEYARIKSKLDYRRRQWREQGPGGDDTAFFKRMLPVFYGLWADRFLPQSMPEMRNTDGERLALTEIWYEVNDREAAIAFLDRHPEIERKNPQDDELVWVWGAPGTSDGLEGSKLLGRFELDREAGLKIEVNSKERAERVRSICGEWGDAVDHIDSRTMETADLLRKKLDEKTPVASEPMDDELRAHMQEYYDGHYRRWLDQPVPMLENLSPREAVEVKRLRPAVTELIRGLESDHERAQRDGGVSHDPTWMWKELGLRRPK